MARQFLSFFDLEKDEIHHLVRRTLEFWKGNKVGEILKGKVIMLLFEKPSTRTRISFESALLKLGAKPIFVKGEDTQLSRGETIEEFARVVSGYVDGVVWRTYDHNNLVRFARKSSVPIINALSDFLHPTQIIADIATIIFVKKRFDGLKVVFLGDCKNNVARSWGEATFFFDFEMVFCCPPSLEPDFEHKGKVEHDPKKAVQGADVLYTDVWFSMGESWTDEKERELEPYQINSELLKFAKDNAIVMHCLPAHVGKEITRDVLESERSVVFTQAHMKLPCAVAVCEMFFAD